MRPSNDAVSTVVDVSLALLLVSASVFVMAMFLQDSGGEEPQPAMEADRTAQTLTVTTITPKYTLEPVTDHTSFDGSDYDEETFTRESHGSAARLLAQAAIANVMFPGADGPELLTRAGVDFERAVDAGIRDRLTGANNRTEVTAVWRPYENATILGTAEAGPSAPAGEDVRTATITVPSGLPPVDEEAVERGYRQSGFEGAARPIARAVVDGLFPPDQSQVALERQGFRRDMVAHRYSRARTILDGRSDTSFREYPDAEDAYIDDRTVISRTGADATRANDALVDHLTPIIADQLRATFGPDATADEIASTVSTDEVTILVRTW